MKRFAVSSIALLLILVAAVLLGEHERHRHPHPLQQMVGARSLYQCVRRLAASNRSRGALHEPVVVGPKHFSPGLPAEKEFSVTVYAKRADETMQAWFYVVSQGEEIPTARQIYEKADMDKLVVYFHRNVVVTSTWLWTPAQYAVVHSCLD